MISLFIDTSQADVSIALLKDNKIVSKINNNIPGEHSIYVTKYIEDTLKNNNITPKDVNEIIIINGPGSFTGIRIGVTIAKIFAYIEKIRIVSITSLKAKAISNNGDYILTKIDAKHGNYYVGLYDKYYNTVIEEFMPNSKLEEMIKEYNPKIIDDEEYNIEEIVKYSKNLKSEHPHAINPVYLKLPEAMEKK